MVLIEELGSKVGNRYHVEIKLEHTRSTFIDCLISSFRYHFEGVFTVQLVGHIIDPKVLMIS